MNLLNINHKLILFSLLIFSISPTLHLYGSGLPNFLFYIFPYNYWPVIFGIFFPILGIAILLLSVTNAIKKIELALIPFLIFLAYYTFPWWIFEYPSDFLWALSPIALFSLLSYGTYFLIKEKLEQTEKITGKEKTTHNLSEELSEKEFVPALLLLLFLGGFGAHRFYVGKIGTGVAMIFTLGGLGIWVLVDFILICIGSFRDAEGRIVKYQRATVNGQVNNTGIAEELEKFAELAKKGIISEEEFNKKKEELL